MTVLLLMQLATSTLGTNTTTPRIIDLSQDIPLDIGAIISSPGARAIQQAASQDPLVRAAIVLEHGDIVSSYHRDDVDPNETMFEVYSTTKSWVSLIIGMLVEDGLISLNETLGGIFPNDDAWADVTDGSTDFRKNVTIEEMLTMTSGLISSSADPFGFANCFGGCSLEDSLSVPDIGVKGEFSYLAASQIPSYIILERSGMTPRQYLEKNVMGKLGIGGDDYDWQQNDDGIEAGYHGLLLTPMQMAKFGQLYLQGGRTNPSNDERVISQEWIDASFTQYAMEDALGLPYGYLFWGMGSAYCAIGMGAQDICVDRALGRVAIQQRDLDWGSMDDMQGLEHLVVTSVALNGTLSFRASDDGILGISSTQPKDDEEESVSLSETDTNDDVQLVATSVWLVLSLTISVLVAVC
eukprot:CAMPEP_0201710262 /NCGR_PEP_ID=MMETSP0578-20130828/58540_1 /ASSEMBLY_ACC=CAM_ASM_000663 /TAXON_ID=267565 /ORGANISM="Skeletonema grethea, Strain CCMP 1804" /LENGTH=409 /DNA_ID=CAMNT_0048199289 /DNA_START=194 /DNA_END=1423 /DNA_ORIENTATION=+